jgi:hypothetical protein
MIAANLQPLAAASHSRPGANPLHLTQITKLCHPDQARILVAQL